MNHVDTRLPAVLNAAYTNLEPQGPDRIELPVLRTCELGERQMSMFI